MKKGPANDGESVVPLKPDTEPEPIDHKGLLDALGKLGIRSNSDDEDDEPLKYTDAKE